MDGDVKYLYLKDGDVKYLYLKDGDVKYLYLKDGDVLQKTKYLEKSVRTI